MGLKNLWRIGGKSINIVSFGGGTNSAAVLVGLHKHKIPVDLILFADTGGEQPHTYQFIRTMDDWLAAHGMPQITVKEHYPDLYRRAVTMEDRAMPHLTSVKGLGRNYAWRERFGAADGGPGPC